MNDKQQQIVEILLDTILATNDHTIDIWDCEGRTVSLSRSKQTILEKLDPNDLNVLVVRDKEQNELGSIVLDFDDTLPSTITDCSTALRPLLASTEALTESLANIPAAPPTPPANPGLIPLHAGSKTLQVRISYVYCNICGRTPNSYEEPNYAPIRFWDPDDGWKIGTLCRWCANEVVDDQPKPEDYAWRHQNRIDDSGTDEDPILAIEIE